MVHGKIVSNTDEPFVLASNRQIVEKTSRTGEQYPSLAILSDGNRSMSVGIGKEMMDATSGGSGFSFDDLAADRAGTLLLAVAATKSGANARNLQTRFGQGVAIADFFPGIEGLPSGLSRDVAARNAMLGNDRAEHRVAYDYNDRTCHSPEWLSVH